MYNIYNDTEENEGPYRDEQLEDNIDEPVRDEIETIIENMKDYKSAGYNGIIAESITFGGGLLKQHIHELILRIWREEEMPSDWELALITTLLKKGEETDCSNYRGISLLDVVYKILSTLLKMRLEKIIDPQLGDYQAGLRKGRSITDNIFFHETSSYYLLRI
ncbi:unnamed protein product [Acanthoscelides obtectus]|uniref:Reverse transcriptase domain-containing protein n=1 Tax=Acanthoscelides obtectus TaxID=200917 RepID=A0A9P0M4E2_ACAOB|nr:unnamed protein product [Acanthoscelides obtectus]CAK1621103.1 hypothetical protein AOBTE_LOCUS769 [Acanthoscelides obtectus]